MQYTDSPAAKWQIKVYCAPGASRKGTYFLLPPATFCEKGANATLALREIQASESGPELGTQAPERRGCSATHLSLAFSLVSLNPILTLPNPPLLCRETKMGLWILPSRQMPQQWAVQHLRPPVDLPHSSCLKCSTLPVSRSDPCGQALWPCMVL